MVINKTIRIGVIGVGHLGNFHLKQLKSLTNIIISGIYDINTQHAKKISLEYDVNLFFRIDDLLNESDAVTIVTPTNTHFSIANKSLDFGCHIFIEKPITDNILSAEKLLVKAKKNKLIIQVGHIERFNPAFNFLKKNIDISPLFIESHRLAKFNSRGNDVPVILDLMIHDLDIILSVVKSKICNIYANGVKVVSSTIDIANARIEFENGCVANLTSSRISQKNMRKMRFFNKNEYITINFLKETIEEYRVSDNVTQSQKENIVVKLDTPKTKYIHYNKPQVKKYDALQKELIHFIDSIYTKRVPETDGLSAKEALNLALKIQKIIE